MSTTILGCTRRRPLIHLPGFLVASRLLAVVMSPVREAATTLSASMAATQSNIGLVQAAINTLQTADSAYGEMIALGNTGLALANTLGDAGVDTSAITAQLVTLTAGIASINTNNAVQWGSCIGHRPIPQSGCRFHDGHTGCCNTSRPPTLAPLTPPF